MPGDAGAQGNADASHGHATGDGDATGPNGGDGDAPVQHHDADASAGQHDGGTNAASDDAGTSDIPGYSTDRSQFFGTPRCPKNALLCDSFEAATLDARWTPDVSNNGSALTLDDMRAARGSRALHAHVTSGFTQAFISEHETFPAAAQGFWGRVFFYVEDPIPTRFNHWTLIEAVGPEQSGSNVLVRFGGIDNPGVPAHHFLFNFEKNPRPQGFNELGIDDQDVPNGRPRQIASNTWHCVEWHYDVPSSEAQFFWDGTERPTLHPKGEVDGTTMAFPAFTSFNLGWTLYQPLDRPYEVWIDELALSLERVGCQR
jgi:hypothetical protein